MKVKAKSLGYYGDKRRYAGQVFHIKKLEEFSFKWMEALDFDPEAEPEKKKVKKKSSKKVSKKSAPKSEPVKPVQEEVSEEPVKPEVNLNEEVI